MYNPDTNTPQPASTQDVKQLNARLVRNALRQQRCATVRELAGQTGLSTVTVGSVLKAQLEQGQVFEDEPLASSGGRPSRRYCFNERHQLVLIAFSREVEGEDALCVRILDLYGQSVAAFDHPLLSPTPEALEQIIAEHLADYPAVAAIGFGLPGVEYEGAIVTLDYAAFIGVPLVARFEQRFGLPVLFENDVNAAVLGRGQLADAPPSEVYLYFPRKYGPGAGIRIDGELVKGRNHFAGELNLLPLDISWEALADAADDAFVEATAKVVLCLTAILNPDSMVLYREDFSAAGLAQIEQKCRARLPQNITPQLSLSKDFSADYQTGLATLTLNLVLN
ncbi:ROK family protein [Saccharospirillum sp. HFRX-1]|uniref:ROK family transcriptional regulator n=1 Tax=unclassified Saccharospirillum TaxID=2633430 RepID=UPI003712D52B